MNALRPERVVIVGMGFGGVYTYLSLHKQFHGTGKLHVTFINDGDRFTFIPLLHEVATGTLQPSGITQPLRTLPHCCIEKFIDGRATSVDFDKQTVHVRRNRLSDMPDAHGHVPYEDEEEVEYDYLVLALGAETNFFAIPGAEENALKLTNMRDARAIKNRIVESFEMALNQDNPADQQASLTFVVAGGGATGVEVAGEIADLITSGLARAFPDIAHLARVVLIERGSILIKGADEWLGNRALSLLKKTERVYVMLETAVHTITEDGVETDKGFIHAHTVIWAAGVKAQTITMTHKKEVQFDEKTGRVMVLPTLQIPSYSNAFVVGDMMWLASLEDGQPYPMRAQFAVRERKTAGRNIARRILHKSLKAFSWNDRGIIISLGKGGSVAKILGVRFAGVFGWVVYRLAYLSSVVGWRAKFRTGLEWVLNVFLPRDISKL